MNKGTKIHVYVNVSIYTYKKIWYKIGIALQIRGEKIDYSIKTCWKIDYKYEIIQNSIFNYFYNVYF